MGFAQALKLVLELEGGAADNPGDPGGETVSGITRETFVQYCAEADGRGVGDFPALSATQVAGFYRWYWDQARVFDRESGASRPLLEMVPEPADEALFQWAVNSGWEIALRGLQAALLAAPDGIVGPLTLGALMRFNGRGAALAALILAAQMMHLGDTHDLEWPFFRGIVDRVERTEEAI
jgi:lysozyme family protein